ncbi:hypothetical protein ANTHELSMS3_03076 [Antarctobacter heliothermus]|uniref:Uncharacterized protein n=1 Tax=Antarctobacter heliothermus TaxID=74033 RepID=A0A222E6U9_9RHOB|nr:hypothetical protein [Antarctobacter heliothermus]ASP21728.1 hypothetical protein ANTHELSMS3_03076 [Antarctobacter heliothermus]|tara:strand:+ start:1969 stop:2112 length:144 start_codon:yes stop_codon:yes gene_type:complete
MTREGRSAPTRADSRQSERSDFWKLTALPLAFGAVGGVLAVLIGALV